MNRAIIFAESLVEAFIFAKNKIIKHRSKKITSRPQFTSGQWAGKLKKNCGAPRK
jgi:hypothetical protein